MNAASDMRHRRGNESSGRHAHAAALVALATLCGGCFYVGLDIEELRTEIYQSTLTVPLATETPLGLSLEASNTFDFDLREELDSGLVELVDYAELTTLRLLPQTGVADLSHVRTVDIQLEQPDSDLPRVSVARYDRATTPLAPDGGLDMTLADEIGDYRDYVTRPVRFHLSLAFENPGKAWAVKVDLGVALGLAYEGKLF